MIRVLVAALVLLSCVICSSGVPDKLSEQIFLVCAPVKRQNKSYYTIFGVYKDLRYHSQPFQAKE